MTVEANLKNLVDGEYIETTKNTPSIPSTSPVKEENSDMKDLLGSSHNTFNKSMVMGNINSSSMGSEGMTGTHQVKIKEEIICGVNADN